ncbi:MAG: c-type cytochrome, partial [Anaerolineales bacterium]
IDTGEVAVSGEEVYLDLCAQCHGDMGEGGIGPALRATSFQLSNTDQEIFDSVSLGHPATPMIAWGEVLTSDQIWELVNVIRNLPESSETEPSSPLTFTDSVLPIFEDSCTACHGSLGGWDASTYEAALESGDHAPVIIPGDADNSLLVQKMLGTQTIGGIMPPGGLLPESQVQIIIDWIEAGAPK